MTAAAAERAAQCDLFDEVGPDALTLCTGWATRDLAAHLVVRERRPDGAIGIVARPFAAHGERVRREFAGKPWDELVELVRSGPPAWSPTRLDAIDKAVNTVEFFVHHEDVRRAQPGWEPRQLDRDLACELVVSLGRMARLLARKSPVAVTLAATDPDGGGPIVAKGGDPTVTIRGPIGELTLFAYGRADHARIEYEGSPDAIDMVKSARFGV